MTTMVNMGASQSSQWRNIYQPHLTRNLLMRGMNTHNIPLVSLGTLGFVPSDSDDLIMPPGIDDTKDSAATSKIMTTRKQRLPMEFDDDGMPILPPASNISGANKEIIRSYLIEHYSTCLFDMVYLARSDRLQDLQVERRRQLSHGLKLTGTLMHSSTNRCSHQTLIWLTLQS